MRSIASIVLEPTGHEDDQSALQWAKLKQPHLCEIISGQKPFDIPAQDYEELLIIRNTYKFITHFHEYGARRYEKVETTFKKAWSRAITRGGGL